MWCSRLSSDKWERQSVKSSRSKLAILLSGGNKVMTVWNRQWTLSSIVSELSLQLPLIIASSAKMQSSLWVLYSTRRSLRSFIPISTIASIKSNTVSIASRYASWITWDNNLCIRSCLTISLRLTKTKSCGRIKPWLMPRPTSLKGSNTLRNTTKSRKLL